MGFLLVKETTQQPAGHHLFEAALNKEIMNE
jgi:hypothetical protein